MYKEEGEAGPDTDDDCCPRLVEVAARAHGHHSCAYLGMDIESYVSYWKCNFPIASHVRLLVFCWAVGVFI